jgi:hypothetical protein
MAASRASRLDRPLADLTRMPKVDASDWTPGAVHEQVERLAAAGAQPVLTAVISWRSAAERRQAAQDRADEQRCAARRSQSVKGANRIRYVR